MSETLPEVGSRLKAAKRFSRVPNLRIQERLGVSRTMVCRYEKGEAVGSKVLLAYAEETGFAISALLDGNHPIWVSVNRKERSKLGNEALTAIEALMERLELERGQADA